LKSYVVAGSDTANPEKFLAYMVPSLDEVDMPLHKLISLLHKFWQVKKSSVWLMCYQFMLLCQLSKDIHDENEEISYTWVREYLWDVCTIANVV
jgi:RNA polymerase II-associated factor 1